MGGYPNRLALLSLDYHVENSLPARYRLLPDCLINVIEFLNIYAQRNDCRKTAASHGAHLPSFLLALSLVC